MWKLVLVEVEDGGAESGGGGKRIMQWREDYYYCCCCCLVVVKTVVVMVMVKALCRSLFLQSVKLEVARCCMEYIFSLRQTFFIPYKCAWKFNEDD